MKRFAKKQQNRYETDFQLDFWNLFIESFFKRNELVRFGRKCVECASKFVQFDTQRRRCRDKRGFFLFQILFLNMTNLENGRIDGNC